jgi:hypothetical protein
MNMFVADVSQQSFVDRLRRLVADDAPLVLIGNFEVEDHWAVGEQGLPRVLSGSSSPVVNRMDELALLLAGPGDRVLLKERPDPDHLGHLAELGVRLPSILVPARQDPGRSVTEDVLRDPGLLAELRQLAGEGFRLLPHGVSAAEERLSAATGMPLAAPAAAVCKAVNSKVYSRNLAERTGLRQPTGWACATLPAFAAAVDEARALLAAGRPVVVKDAFGVSGKGIAVVRDQSRLDRLLRKVTAACGKRGRQDVALVVEEWVAKDCDYNYQFTVGRDGSAHFDFVKRAITENGVHKGHRVPSGLDDARIEELASAARTIGAGLASDGYWGVVGVDAMSAPDGTLYPVVEINARNNMATYLATVQDTLLPPGTCGLVREYPLRLDRRLTYAVVRGALDGLLWSGAGSHGLLVNDFATVNAAWRSDAPFDGRLYGVVVAGDDAGLAAIDARITGRLNEFQKEVPSV